MLGRVCASSSAAAVRFSGIPLAAPVAAAASSADIASHWFQRSKRARSVSSTPFRNSSNAPQPPPPAAAAKPTVATTLLQPPLSEPLAGIPVLRPARNLPTPKVLVTTLPNGLRVATQETYGQVATLALFVDAGSMYENAGDGEVGVYGAIHAGAMWRFASAKCG